MLVQAGKVEHPRYHLSAWLLCRKLQGDSMARVLPDAGGALDQNWELTWAFGILEDAYTAEYELKTKMQRDSVQLEDLRQQLLRA